MQRDPYAPVKLPTPPESVDVTKMHPKAALAVAQLAAAIVSLEDARGNGKLKVEILFQLGQPTKITWGQASGHPVIGGGN